MTCTKPYALSATLEQVLRQQCGLDQKPFSNADIRKLAHAVKKIADVYTEGRQPDDLFSDPALRRAYSAYYLPCNAIKLFPILSELERRSLLPPRKQPLRVLDLGCGPGTLFAGLLDYFLQHSKRADITLNITGIDRNPGNCSAARALLEAFLAKAPEAPEVHSVHFLTGEVRSLDRLTMASPEDGFDLILAGNLINELHGNALADLADRITALLKPTGMIIILDPGTRQSFKNLLMFRQEMLNRHDMHLAAPCLQAAPCPLQDCKDAWCHEKLFWTPPLIVRLIDQHTGFTKHKGVKFSYLAMTRDNKDPLTLKNSSACADLWRVTSYVIRNKGEERLYVCNGRKRLLLRRLTRITNPASSDFSCSERGDIVNIKKTEPRSAFMNVGPETVFQKII